MSWWSASWTMSSSQSHILDVGFEGLLESITESKHIGVEKALQLETVPFRANVPSGNRSVNTNLEE